MALVIFVPSPWPCALGVRLVRLMVAPALCMFRSNTKLCRPSITNFLTTVTNSFFFLSRFAKRMKVRNSNFKWSSEGKNCISSHDPQVAASCTGVTWLQPEADDTGSDHYYWWWRHLLVWIITKRLMMMSFHPINDVTSIKSNNWIFDGIFLSMLCFFGQLQHLIVQIFRNLHCINTQLLSQRTKI